MAVREFTDSRGDQWRAWDITPESLHPQTRAEDYLADAYRGGWVVFENLRTGERRRLGNYPMGWQHLATPDLERLMLERGEPVALIGKPVPEEPPRPVTPREVEVAARQVERSADMEGLGVVRSFIYPSGRVWAVCVVKEPEGGGPPVLRFQSGRRHIDVGLWPADWVDMSDTELVALLRNAAPRDEPWHDGFPQRRYDDPRTTGGRA